MCTIVLGVLYFISLLLSTNFYSFHRATTVIIQNPFKLSWAEETISQLKPPLLLHSSIKCILVLHIYLNTCLSSRHNKLIKAKLKQQNTIERARSALHFYFCCGISTVYTLFSIKYLFWSNLLTTFSSRNNSS